MAVLKVGITGHSGFIGYHLTQYLRTQHKDEIEIIPFDTTYFKNPEQLQQFVHQCDTIVHLAAKNRGRDEDIYATNIQLVQQLIAALESTKHTPHVIFSSSIQAEKNTIYGRSKSEGDNLFIAWAKRNNTRYTSLIIPNVFGPFGRPFYNSVVATFCYQLTHGQEPEVKVDALLPLISVRDLTMEFFKVIRGSHNQQKVYARITAEIKVSAILMRLREFKELYFDHHIIPNLNGNFDIDLFNTFRSFFESDHNLIYPEVHRDTRGFLTEIIKELSGGQVFFSATMPSITRGNHFHTRKIERFCVIQGTAKIRLRKIGTTRIIEYQVRGSEPSFIDIPVYYTHNITNIGDSNVLTMFWTNELFNPADPDTFYENV